MKVAVVGSGVSGLVCAHRLGPHHDVTLFEADDRLGGHAHTVDVEDGEGTLALDTAFLVCNRRTYPNFLALLTELGVDTVESDMSFSVRSVARDFEYSGRGLSTMYTQRRRIFSPRFHRMVWDILRFHREARDLLQLDDELPLARWLRERGFSEQFLGDHLAPMVRAVWSANEDVLETFPAKFLVRFFHNHGFLSAAKQTPWLTIPGGSRRYVQEVSRRFPGEVRLRTPVTQVTRSEGGAWVSTVRGARERFDHVVLACHADQALRMLVDPSSVELDVLRAFPYQPNEAVLHTDETLMPRTRRAWSAWNVHLDDAGVGGACVTYWLNRLQPIRSKKNYFVTLNHTHAIDPSKVLRTFAYSHPMFGLASVRAQSRHAELIDHRSTSYCGAYWRNGFHEDGVVSALEVCARLQAQAQSRAA